MQPPPTEGADLRREELLVDKLAFRIDALFSPLPDGLYATEVSSEAIKSRLDAAIRDCRGPKPRVYARGTNGAADVSGTMLAWLMIERQPLAFPVHLNLRIDMAEPGWVTVKGTCTLNGMDSLATTLGIDRSRNLSLDGNTNHLGRPASQIAAGLQDRQLDLLEAVLAHVLEFFPWLASKAADGVLASPEGSFEMSTAEVCADLGVSDAKRLMTFAASGWQHGMVERNARQFQGSWKATTVRALGAPVTTFAAHTSLVRAKAYAKRPDCVRLEVAAPRLSGVRATMEGTEVPKDLTATSAREQIRTFVEMAAPLADEQFDFLERVSRSGRKSPADLAIALLPLLEAAIGEPSGKPGAPTSAGTRAEIKNAFNGLVTGTGYKVDGNAAKSALRKVLDSLCKPGGPLQKHPRLLHYSVRADFAKACMEYAIVARPVVQFLAAESGDQGCAGGTAHGFGVEETPDTFMEPDGGPAEPDVTMGLDNL